jgi:anti-anti-sigma regulatory factor
MVAAGDHACLTFTDAEQRLDLLAAFVGEGLDVGDRVLCLVDSIPPADLPDQLAAREVRCAEAVDRGQLSVTGSDASWLAGGGPGAGRMIDLLLAELERASGDGYHGLRVTADMAWVRRPHAAAAELLRFEADVAGLFGDGRLTTVCQYDRELFDPVTLAFAVEAHDRVVAAQVYHDDAILQICRQYRPAGVRIGGELDYRRLEPLHTALSEAIRLDHDVAVNLRRLRYVDAAAAGAVVQAALTLPEGRAMHVTCTPLVATVLELSGARDVPALRLTTVR